jgi:hypothetical protein
VENARVLESLRNSLAAHLASRQVSRVIYGAIIGLALIVALEADPADPGPVVATLIGTAIAVGLAEGYSELIGFELRRHQRATGEARKHLRAEVGAVAFGIAFPSIFFILASAGAYEDQTAYTLAKWAGLGLIALYGFVGARVAGNSLARSLLQATAVALIGAILIALKAIVH